MLIPIAFFIASQAAPLPTDPNQPEAKPDPQPSAATSAPAPTAAPTPTPTPAPAVESKQAETDRSRMEPLASEKEAECAEKKDGAAKGPNVAAITGLVGSAATVATALGGVIVAIAAVPAPWDYWKYAQDLHDAEAAFRRNPDVRHINDAGRARAGLEGIEQGFSDQLGVIVTSGISLATGATGLVASIVTVAGE